MPINTFSCSHHFEDVVTAYKKKKHLILSILIILQVNNKIFNLIIIYTLNWKKNCQSSFSFIVVHLTI